MKFCIKVVEYKDGVKKYIPCRYVFGLFPKRITYYTDANKKAFVCYSWKDAIKVIDTYKRYYNSNKKINTTIKEVL